MLGDSSSQQNSARRTKQANFMRTKTLLLTVAMTAVTLAPAIGQVFSENVVGIVTKTVPPNGFALISNPLLAADNSIGVLFSPAPSGTAVFKFDSATAQFITATFDDLDNAFLPKSAADQKVLPGEGVFVRNPTRVPLTFTFVGVVPQGDLKNPLPKGLSMLSSQVPQAGTAADLGLIGSAGDTVFQWDTATQRYRTSTFDDLDNAWLPPLGTLEVGDAFFLSKQQAGSWDRRFSVSE